MKIDEALLWQYIEGTCSEEEREQVEAALQSDADLQQAYRERKELNKLLENSELEQPSMRFTQNVMEKLPQLYSKLLQEPLLQKSWWKWTIGSLSAIFVAVTVLIMSANNDAIPELPLAQETQAFIQGSTEAVLSQTSNFFWILLLSVSLSIGLLFWLDKYLKKQLGAKKSQSSGS